MCVNEKLWPLNGTTSGALPSPQFTVAVQASTPGSVKVPVRYASHHVQRGIRHGAHVRRDIRHGDGEGRRIGQAIVVGYRHADRTCRPARTCARDAPLPVLPSPKLQA